MKKLIVSLLAVAMLFSLVSCASTPPTSDDNNNTANNSQTTSNSGNSISYPEKTIEVIVPFAAGGAVDSALRPLLIEAEKTLGQPMIIENKEGSGAMIGLSYAAEQEADGYTLVALTNSFVTNILLKGATFDMDSFDIVCGFCLEPAYVVVSASSDIQSLDDLIEKGQNEELVNVTPGNGTLYHIASTIISDQLGVKFKYVHSDGGSEQAIQLAGGHAEVALMPYSSCASLVDQGKIRVLAILNDARSEELPDTPTALELGYDLVFGAYRGLAVPAGTDPDIISTIESAIGAAAENPDIIQQYKSSNIPLVFKTGEEFRKIVEDDYAGIQSVMDILTEG